MTTAVSTLRGEPTRLVTDDGVTLQAWYRGGASPADAGVVLIHGFGGEAGTEAIGLHAQALHDAGLDVLVYDARGHGGSGGVCSLGADERHDVAAAVRTLRGHVDRVVVVGESAGGIAALHHAASADDVAGVVTVGSPAAWTLKLTLPALVSILLTQTSAGRRFCARYLEARVVDRRVPMDHPHRLASRVQVPLAVVHGQSDRFIPPREAKVLRAGAGGASRLDLVASMGHGFRPESVPVVVDAVRWALDTAESRLP